MAEKLNVSLATQRGSVRNFDTGLVIGEFVSMSVLVAPNAAASERVVLAHARDIPGERGGRGGCDGVGVNVV